MREEIMMMKLNLKMPNESGSSTTRKSLLDGSQQQQRSDARASSPRLMPPSLLSLRPCKLTLSIGLLLFCCCLLRVQSYRLQQEPTFLNEISQQKETNFSKLPRDVANLRLTPDFRSIRLRWNYELVAANMPASFEVRYCELTSWMAEIKCRHKDVRVATVNSSLGLNDVAPDYSKATRQLGRSAGGGGGGALNNNNNNNNSTVISNNNEADLARVLDDDDSRMTGRLAFETQIYDLRALTNYTFDVRVLQFEGEHEPLPSASGTALNQLAKRHQEQGNASRPARRLDLSVHEPGRASQLLHDTQQTSDKFRIETKPFQAEAVKCLANSSEVLISTGRYFGGRISVDWAPSQPHHQPPAECQLAGNRSSPQSSYLFRINHELCGSKVLDSSRIETMVLVHENRGILTHNTARFLVQCNIAQKSFTVHASISLPKVNGLSRQQTRPATITPLAGKPQVHEEPVRLGSMPGVYRLMRSGHSPTEAGPANQRWAKELHQTMRDDDKSTQALEVPRPVEVSSKLLFVEPSSGDSAVPVMNRNARLLHATAASKQAQLVRASTFQAHVSDNMPLNNHKSLQVNGGTTNNNINNNNNNNNDNNGPQLQPQPDSLISSGSDAELALASRSQPIIMTNNHRVSSDFLPLAQLMPISGGGGSGGTRNSVGRESRTMPPVEDDQQQPKEEISFKYSPVKVDEYPLGQVLAGSSGKSTTGQGALLPPSLVQARSRSGRMRQIANSSSQSTAETITTTSPLVKTIESRMGDVLQQQQPASDLLGAESSVNEMQAAPMPRVGLTGAMNSSQPLTTSSTVGPTLAHNITGALIRWSLKTLGSLARKSLESLASEAELAASMRNYPNRTSDSSLEDLEPRGRENIQDGFLVNRPNVNLKSGNNQLLSTSSSAATTTTASSQQPSRAATQSADLVQSAKPHQLPPPPAIQTAPPPSKQSATPSTLMPAASASVRTARPTARLHKTTDHQARAKFYASPAGLEQSSNLLPNSSQDETLAKAEPAQGVSFSSPLWPIYVLSGLIGLVALTMLVIYVAMASSKSSSLSSPGLFFSPPKQRRRNNNNNSTNSKNDTSRHHANLSSILARLPSRQHSVMANQLDTQSATKLNRAGYLLSSASVQSPHLRRCDRFAPGQLDRSQEPLGVCVGNGADGAVLTSPSSQQGSATTRSTSAASTSNISTRTSSTLERQENYCKNLEQLVYSDYLLLNNSDCLSNESSGRESFA